MLLVPVSGGGRVPAAAVVADGLIRCRADRAAGGNTDEVKIGRAVSHAGVDVAIAGGGGGEDGVGTAAAGGALDLVGGFTAKDGRLPAQSHAADAAGRVRLRGACVNCPINMILLLAVS